MIENRKIESPLVSIVIPCYNAERWLSHAILSCLEQTYKPVEIIIIDDGSTDGSLDIIKSYDKVVIWESGPNRGGNAARNRGFALSKGQYIQFLDADDYLLPEKIACQVSSLESTGGDVVYGDWQHRFHKSDSTSFLGEVVISGPHNDIIATLLSPWWIANNALLFRREAVIKSGGWDEQLAAAQDKDFLLSVALSGGTFQYLPGCVSVYRRYGNVTVSTSSNLRRVENLYRLLKKAEVTLINSNRLYPHYYQALAESFFWIAKAYYETDRARYNQLLREIYTLQPDFKPKQTLLYNLLQSLFGLEVAQRVGSYKRRLLRKLGRKSDKIWFSARPPQVKASKDGRGLRGS